MSKLLPHNWTVPEKFRARLGTQAGKQRVMVHEGHLLVILHTVPEPGELTRKAAIFWRAPDSSWKSTGAAAKGGVVAMRAHLEVFTTALTALEERVEAAARAADYFAVLHAVAPILRTARALHKTMQEAREAQSNDADLITLRDHACDIERAAELVHSDAKNGLEFTIAKRAEEQAELGAQIAVSSHRLNLLAALFLPVTAVATVFSMNFLHGFETRFAPWLFWAVLVFSFLLGFIVRAGLKSKDPALS
jgi:hypothetical protein